MATTFNPADLDPALYTLANPAHLCRLQTKAEEFMHIVRTDPIYFKGKEHLLRDFARLLSNEKTYRMAANVVPELRLSQNHDVSKDTAMNLILRALTRWRPPPALRDPKNTVERNLIKQRFRTYIEYMEWDAAREEATAEEEQEVKELTARAIRVALGD